MKKLIAHAALLAIFIHPILLAQSGWVWLNPLPQGNYLSNVSYVNSSLVYVSGYGGTLMKSTDGGNNFTVIPTGIREPLRLNFINELTGFSASGTGILRTTDGGYNWQYFQLPTDYETDLIQFLPSANVFALKKKFSGNYLLTVLYKSTDLGATWTESLYPGANNSINSFHFPNSTTGYAVGRKPIIDQYSKIFKTTNSGVIWDSITSTIKYQLWFVHFLNSGTGFVTTNASRNLILKTTNGCTSWDTVYTQMMSSSNGLRFFDNMNGYVRGSQEVLITTNSGMSWQRISTHHNLTLFNISDGLGIGVINNNNFLFRTTNTGSNWTQITQGFYDDLSDITFINNNTGFAVGRGKIYKTTDSGFNWSTYVLYPQNSYAILNIMFLNESTGYAGVDEGKIAKTTNCGLNWQIYETGCYDHNHGLSFPSINTGYAVTKMGYYLKTTNAGINWITLDYVEGHQLEDVYFINNFTGFAAGSYLTDGIIRRTTNGGLNWTITIIDSLYRIDDVCVSDSSTWYAAGYGEYYPSNYAGFIYRSTNMGASWSFIRFPGSLHSICFPTKLVGYASSIDGIMYKTTDGGNSWFATQCINASPSFGIFFVNNNTGWAVSYLGQIIKTTTGGGNIIGVNPVSSEVPHQFILHQNYPNPFNPITHLRFEISDLRHVKVVIYDILGREITTLVNEQLQPGVYEVAWDGTNYPSGVYFYRLSVAETSRRDVFTQTRKMVLLK